MRTLLGTLALVLALPLAGPSAAATPNARPAGDLSWDVTVVDADQSFRGLDAVDRNTAWVSGGSLTEGGPAKVWRTTDGGDSWQDVSPPETDGLAFRDVEARSADVAQVLAIGSGEASRIYRTTDGGQTWEETFRNPEPTAFYNCMDFFPGGRRGLAVSDPVEGKFQIIGTDDGGRSWQLLPNDGMPDSTGEFNFAASGDCLVISGQRAYFGSGGAAARVFRSNNHGLTWRATDSTIPAGEAAGVFGLAFRDSPRHGLAVGGDFAAPADTDETDNAHDITAFTRNGHAWTNGGDLEHLGEDAAWLPGTTRTFLTVGESGAVAGSSISKDGGRTWRSFGEVGFHTLDCTYDGACWAAGGGGRVGRL
jgi:photosystem II stability/assembly factor-like uncharacterized protein